METKYLCQIELRYNKKPTNHDEHSQYVSDKLTIGIYDTREQAIEETNKTLPLFEERFPLNPSYRRRERFSAQSFKYSQSAIITEITWVTSPIAFFVTIFPLHCVGIEDITKALDSAIEANKEYKAWKQRNRED